MDRWGLVAPGGWGPWCHFTGWRKEVQEHAGAAQHQPVVPHGLARGVPSSPGAALLPKVHLTREGEPPPQQDHTPTFNYS